MAIEIRLVGFGDERPPRCGARDRLLLDIDTPATPRQVLDALGIDDDNGLVLMNTDHVIPARRWHEASVQRGDRLTLLAAIEGG